MDASKVGTTPAGIIRARRWMRHLPRRSNVARYPGLRRLSRHLLRLPHLWSYKAPYTTRALYMGAVITWLPIMGAQIPISALLAIVLRTNLSIAVGLQLLSNPLTAAPMYGASYKVGQWLLALSGVDGLGVVSAATLDLTVGGIVLGGLLGVSLDAMRRLATRNRRIRAASLRGASPAAECGETT